jgi:hypothetical protein
VAGLVLAGAGPASAFIPGQSTLIIASKGLSDVFEVKKKWKFKKWKKRPPGWLPGPKGRVARRESIARATLPLISSNAMATEKDLRRIALSLEGTTEAPHFDRTAFKVARIYVTLASDGRTANLKLSPDEQEFKGMMAPEALPRSRMRG